MRRRVRKKGKKGFEAMIRKLPIIGHTLTLGDIRYGVLHAFDEGCKDLFCQSLLEYTASQNVFLLNSGIASFYVILEALKKISSRNEVLLPCYTAPSLVVAIQKAGLKPVLCDIRLTDFNMDSDEVFKKINQNTLCILGVHMFGIPWEDIVDFKKKIHKDIFVIEDCAQAFGSKINGRLVGRCADISFYSFNRGKNLPTYDGGCIVTNSKELADGVREAIAEAPSPGVLTIVSLALKLWALYFSFKPFFYGIFSPLIARFKDNSVPEDFRVFHYSSFQAAVGNSLLIHAREAFALRCENGRRLIALLEGMPGIIVPKIPENVVSAFNRFPLVFKEIRHKDRVIERLHRAGIESSKLYLEPLHHIFDLGYKKDDFPNAVYFAERLLTLPVHPLVTQEDIEVMVKVIKEVVSR